MNVLELKKEIDDYIEAGGDKYCEVLIENLDGSPRKVRNVWYDEYSDEQMGEQMGGLVIR